MTRMASSIHRGPSASKTITAPSRFLKENLASLFLASSLPSMNATFKPYTCFLGVMFTKNHCHVDDDNDEQHGALGWDERDVCVNTYDGDDSVDEAARAIYPTIHDIELSNSSTCDRNWGQCLHDEQRSPCIN